MELTIYRQGLLCGEISRMFQVSIYSMVLELSKNFHNKDKNKCVKKECVQVMWSEPCDLVGLVIREQLFNYFPSSD